MAGAKQGSARRSTTKAGKGRAAKPKAGARGAGRGRGAAEEGGLSATAWALMALVLIGAITVLRLTVNAADLIPVHFDEAQYWAYGQELAWGYFSKPPGVGVVIRVATDLGGDTLFAMRFASPLCHAVIALALFALGRRLFDARTGFWAALAYALAPGVSVSALIMSTDPVMMAAWALGLLAMVAAMEREAAGRDARLAWAGVGLAIGLGSLAKYTMLAMPASAFAYGLFSARGRAFGGMMIAGGVGLLVLAPNLLWNAANGFATVTHVAEDADPGQGYFNPLKLAEFAGAQLGVIGPVVFLAILAAFWHWRDWVGDWRMRLLAWQTGLLLFAILGLAFVTRAQPNWAAPAYIAGCLFATRWLLISGRPRLLGLQAGIGVVAALAVWAAAALYADRAGELPRWGDPFKKMRIAEPFCGPALAAMAEEGAEVLLSNDRRRLSECMFLGGLGWDEIAVWNPEIAAENHHEMVATLLPGDSRLMLLAVMGDPAPVVAAFEEARLVDEHRFATHADRDYPLALWLVSGFRDYDTEY
ncbi:MAG: glycosyltransferase family 39 protein [Pseudomonadota bacterium]